MAQYTFTGYDASAHMTEETHDASTAGPKGIVRSIWTSWIAGFVLLLGFTFAIQSYDGALTSPTGAPPARSCWTRWARRRAKPCSWSSSAPSCSAGWRR
ncbi:hypothetical protein STENM36S_09357 [Streptomyces tendae]